jgi:hypothetical protein
VELQMAFHFGGELALTLRFAEEFREPDEERAQLSHKCSCFTNNKKPFWLRNPQCSLMA